MGRAGNVYELCFISKWGIVHTCTFCIRLTSSFLSAMNFFVDNRTRFVIIADLQIQRVLLYMYI